MSRYQSFFGIPIENWGNRKLKYICSINPEVLSADTPADYEFEYVDIGSVEYGKGIIEKKLVYFEDSPSRARRKVKYGDVIVSTVRTYLKAIASITDENKDIIVSTGFAVVHPEKINKEFMAYLLTSKPFVETIVSESVGVSYPAISPTKLASIKIPFPEKEIEQIAIANFLDRKTKDIQIQIEKIKGLIELLQEEKEVLIINAVTRGLDTNVQMKDSGIDWIGEIPTHWEVTRIKWTKKYGANSFSDGDWIESEHITDEGVRLIQTGNIGIGEYIEQGGRYISEDSFDELKCKELYAGDVLICRLASPVGRSCLCPDMKCKMITSVDVCFLRPSDTWDNRYIVYSLSNPKYLDYVDVIARGSTRQRISRTQVGDFNILSPPLQEQIDIANYLDDRLSYIASVISKNEDLIKKLTEYQEALITAAVTGKIIVRGE